MSIKQQECALNSDYDDYLDQKYSKRKKKKTVIKANHKHNYIDFIGEKFDGKYTYYFPVARCDICGKVIHSKKYFMFYVADSDGHRILFDLDEIKNSYPMLDVLVVDDLI